jgi:hypothetical protein
MVGRVRVEIVTDGTYRLCETDGRLVHSWLPEVEDDDWLPLDRGGFEEQHDAFGFALAVDLIRAEAGRRLVPVTDTDGYTLRAVVPVIVPVTASCLGGRSF